jgi:[acyl-carrier-protein] S-malonyltransferase
VTCGAEIIPLFDSPSFHCGIMEPLIDKIKKVLGQVIMNPFRCPVYANVTGEPYKDIYEVIPNLSAQVANPVRWYDITKCMETCDNIEVYIEIGSQNTLSALLKRSFPLTNVVSFTRSKDISEINCSIQNKEQDKQMLSYKALVNLCFKYTVSLKNYNRDSKAFLQSKAVAKYQRLQKEIINLDSIHKKPVQNHGYQALEMLRDILSEKGVTQEEKKETINDLLADTSSHAGIADMIHHVMNDIL